MPSGRLLASLRQSSPRIEHQVLGFEGSQASLSSMARDRNRAKFPVDDGQRIYNSRRIVNTCLPPYRDKTREDTNLSLVSVSAQSLQEEQMFDGGELGDKGRP